MTLEDEPIGELPGTPESDVPPAPGAGWHTGPAAGDARSGQDANDQWLDDDRTPPRTATSRADKRRNSRRR